MRKGERARVMVKPKYGYAYKSKEPIFFPRGWTDEDKKQQLMSRRVFFEIKMHEWTVRHDLNADGIFVKTVKAKGQGFHKPVYFDEVTFKVKMFQKHKTFWEEDSVTCKLNDEEALPLTAKTILQTMKS